MRSDQAGRRRAFGAEDWGPNEFLAAGIDCRARFALPVHSGGKQAQLRMVEDGHCESGAVRNDVGAIATQERRRNR